MAENGFFRVSLRGFNKKDVLQYIDELQTTHAERLNEAETLRSDAEQALAAERAAANERVSREVQLEEEIAKLREKNEQLLKIGNFYRSKCLELQNQTPASEQNDSNNQELEQAVARIRELEDQAALLKEQNDRYATVVGDVSRLVVEARVVSASYLDAAHQKSSECITELDKFLSDLKLKVEKVREYAAANRKAGDVHMESLLSDLKDLGQSLTSTYS